MLLPESYGNGTHVVISASGMAKYRHTNVTPHGTVGIISGIDDEADREDDDRIEVKFPGSIFFNFTESDLEIYDPTVHVYASTQGRAAFANREEAEKAAFGALHVLADMLGYDLSKRETRVGSHG